MHALAKDCARAIGGEARAAAVAEAVRGKSKQAARFAETHPTVFKHLVDPETSDTAAVRLMHLCSAKAAMERGEYPSYDAATAAVSQYLLAEAKEKMQRDGRLASAD